MTEEEKAALLRAGVALAVWLLGTNLVLGVGYIRK